MRDRVEGELEDLLEAPERPVLAQAVESLLYITVRLAILWELA